MNKLFLTPLVLLGSLATGCSSFYGVDDGSYYDAQSYTVLNESQRHGYMKPIGAQKSVYQFPSSRIATGKNVFIFDPRHRAWAAYDRGGNLIKQGRASGGKDYCPDIKRACRTPAGTYAVYRKGDATCVSTKYPLGKGGAPMPHCMFFHGGYAIHGSNHVPTDHNASHGCVRVTASDAAWLSQHHINHGATVIVRPY
ncbi:MAG: L,D-transpeptidase [Gammaproteobacteria bacterium]